MTKLRRKRMPHQVFTERDFYVQLAKDLKEAKSLAIIQSAFITERQLEQLGDMFKNCIGRGVAVCAYVQKPRSDASPEKTAQFENAVRLLSSWGVHVNIRRKVHEKIIIVDDSIAWEGSLNTFSHYDTSERMTRWVSRAKVLEMIKTHHLNTCDRCAQFSGFEMLPESVTKLDGRCIAELRRATGFSLCGLARATGIDRRILASIEKEQTDVKISTLKRIYQELGLSVVRIPWYLVPAVQEFVRKRST